MPKTPRDPDIVDAEYVDKAWGGSKLTPKQLNPPNPKGCPNPAWVEGAPSPNAGGMKKEHRALLQQTRQEWRELFQSKGIPAMEKYLDNDNVDPSEKAVVILKMAEFVMPKPKAGQAEDDTTGQGGGETRTMTVTFVTPKKD